jgi:hypothetical protein
LRVIAEEPEEPEEGALSIVDGGALVEYAGVERGAVEEVGRDSSLSLRGV